MILTCPACATQYVVKDGAIPAGGRKVRCAACKESWHQDPEEIEAVSADAAGLDDEVMTSPPPFEPTSSGGGFTENPAIAAGGSGFVAPEEDFAEHPQHAPDNLVDEPHQVAPEAELEPRADDDDFAYGRYEEPEAPRRGLWLLLVVLLLVALAAVAAWFLAPASLRSRLGLADAGRSPLELMLTTSDRQPLASGNELLAISGRVINPTDEEQAVPPIRAELRNKASGKSVYRWTIAPPARVLPPGGSASFNSAEVDIPSGGDELTVTLGGAAS